MSQPVKIAAVYYGILLGAVFILVTGSGCDNRSRSGQYFGDEVAAAAKRNTLVENAIHHDLATNNNASSVAWREFASNWPAAKQGMGYVWRGDSATYDATVDSVAIIADRYLLRIILNLTANKDCTVISLNKLRFNLEGVKYVLMLADGGREGGATIQYDTDKNYWFGIDEWQKLMTSHFDFAKIGINIVSNAPVPHIGESLK